MKAYILDKSQESKWNDFVATQSLATIHQHSSWGSFQEKIPSRGKYWIIVLEERGKIIGGTVLIRHGLARNMCWLYCARGPLLNWSGKNIQAQTELLLEPIRQIAHQENAIFVRFDPPLTGTDRRPKLKGFYSSHLGFQPEDTLLLDLTQTEDEILAQMKPKGRYNIRLAEKKGVQIRIADPSKPKKFAADLSAFHKILHETTTRDQFYGHKKVVYQNMLEILCGDGGKIPLARLYLAEYEGRIIAGIVATFYLDTAIYYYGASSNAHRNVMAPYLLQWQAICDARKLGLKHYDFLGIAPPEAKKHAWAGVTDFKLKFGGQSISYQAPWEYPFKKLRYLGYRFYKWLK